MILGEELVELDGPVGRCSSTAAADVARRLAARRRPGARLYRLAATEGILDDATATRWEASFDVPDRMVTLDITVTFTWDEDRRAYGSGIASVAEHPFPPEGSELERMLVARTLTRRRLKGIWRQHLADRPHLPERVPDAAEAVMALRDGGVRVGIIRTMVAKVSRSGGPLWVVTGDSGEHKVRWRLDGDRIHLVV